MSSEHTFEDKGKVKPKPSLEAAEPAKDGGSLTAADMEGKLDASTLTQMQQTVGNAAVQRFLAQRQVGGPAEIQEETADAINSKRGSGSSLDEGMAQRAGDAMGHDFSGVNVHTDSEADGLSRDLGAKAFTTGSDIFFQSGAYNPDSSDGQELIAHELTHVAQQGGAASGGSKMTVNDPNDQYEEEADSVAGQIMNQPDPNLQRQEVPEEEPAAAKADPNLQRQEVPEEEPAAAKADPNLQRQEVPEEEPAAAKADPSLQRQEVPEEEPAAALKVDPVLQRQEVPEEEPPAALKADPNLQRVDEEEPMAKADPNLQRVDEEEPMAKADPNLQRVDEEEPMAKADPNLQRVDEEEPMAKADPDLQRIDEEEPMPKLDPALQRQEMPEEDPV
jgi:hypothetical protein